MLLPLKKKMDRAKSFGSFSRVPSLHAQAPAASNSGGGLAAPAGSMLNLRGLITESRERRKTVAGGFLASDVDVQTAVFSASFGRPGRMPKIALSKAERARVHSIYEKIRIRHQLFPVRCLEPLFRQCGIGTLQWIAVADRILSESGWHGVLREISTLMASALKKLAQIRDEPHTPEKQLSALIDSASHIGVPVIAAVHAMLHSPHVDETQTQEERPAPMESALVQDALKRLCCESGVPDETAFFVPEKDVHLGLMRIKHVACATESIIAATPIVLMDAISKLTRNLESSAAPPQSVCQLALAERVGAIYARAAAGFEDEGNASYINFTEQIGVMASVIELGTDPWASIGLTNAAVVSAEAAEREARERNNEDDDGNGENDDGGKERQRRASSPRAIAPAASASASASASPASVSLRRSPTPSSPVGTMISVSPSGSPTMWDRIADDSAGNISAFSSVTGVSLSNVQPESPLRKSSIATIAESFGLKVENSGPTYLTLRDKERKFLLTNSSSGLMSPQKLLQDEQQKKQQQQQQQQQKEGPATEEQKRQQQQQQQLAVADLLTLDSISKEFFQPQASAFASALQHAGSSANLASLTDGSNSGGGRMGIRKASTKVATMIRVTNTWQAVAADAIHHNKNSALSQGMNANDADDYEPVESETSEESEPHAQELFDRCMAIASPMALHPGSLETHKRRRRRIAVNVNNTAPNGAASGGGSKTAEGRGHSNNMFAGISDPVKLRTAVLANRADERRRSSIYGMVGMTADDIRGAEMRRRSSVGATSAGAASSQASSSAGPAMPAKMSAGARLYHLRQRLSQLEKS